MRYRNALSHKMAEDAKRRVLEILSGVLRHPTGRYESEIRIDGGGAEIHVNDGTIVYGPWLEGDGSRNSPNTKFPGYHTFRIAGQQIDHDAYRESNDYLHEGGFLEEMN